MGTSVWLCVCVIFLSCSLWTGSFDVEGDVFLSTVESQVWAGALQNELQGVKRGAMFMAFDRRSKPKRGRNAGWSEGTCGRGTELIQQ